MTGSSLTGSNSARETARTVWVPNISMVTATSTSTILEDQLGSVGHLHLTRVAPFSIANLCASSAGEPSLPKGRKVTGAAARAAASAAATARPRPADTTPPAAAAVAKSTSSPAMTAAMIDAAPPSGFTAPPSSPPESEAPPGSHPAPAVRVGMSRRPPPRRWTRPRRAGARRPWSGRRVGARGPLSPPMLPGWGRAWSPPPGRPRRAAPVSSIWVLTRDTTWMEPMRTSITTGSTRANSTVAEPTSRPRC